MPLVISFVGKSNSGKTTLLEKVIAILKSRNIKTAIIKHDAHSFEMDKEGKDTYRHKKAGASAVAISSFEKMALIKDTGRDLSLSELISHMPADCDLIITEGFKKEKMPKVEVFREGHNDISLCYNDSNLIAYATDTPENKALNPNIIKLDINNPDEVADFLIKYLTENQLFPSEKLLYNEKEAENLTEEDKKLLNEAKEKLSQLSIFKKGRINFILEK